MENKRPGWFMFRQLEFRQNDVEFREQGDEMRSNVMQ